MKMRRGKCPNCERLAARVAELEKQLAAALARIAELERQLAAARKDSSWPLYPWKFVREVVEAIAGADPGDLRGTPRAERQLQLPGTQYLTNDT